MQGVPRKAMKKTERRNQRISKEKMEAEMNSFNRKSKKL